MNSRCNICRTGQGEKTWFCVQPFIERHKKTRLLKNKLALVWQFNPSLLLQLTWNNLLQDVCSYSKNELSHMATEFTWIFKRESDCKIKYLNNSNIDLFLVANALSRKDKTKENDFFSRVIYWTSLVTDYNWGPHYKRDNPCVLMGWGVITTDFFLLYTYIHIILHICDTYLPSYIMPMSLGRPYS